MKYKLDDIEKKQVFKVPSNYFEELPLKIQTKIQKEKKQKRIVLPSWKFAFAASILVFVVTYFITNQNPTSVESLLAEIPQNELIAYLEEVELDIEDLAILLPDASDDGFESLDGLNELDIEEEELDDLLLEYDINDDYL